MNHTDVDLSTLTKEQLIDIIKKAGRNTRKRPSKQELFENIMIYLESKYKQIPEELIISQLTETGRYSITQARKCLFDACQFGYLTESKPGYFKRV